MIEHALRLKKGDDLALSIADYCLKKKINTAIILSGVGCLDNLHIRLAGAKTTLNKQEDLDFSFTQKSVMIKQKRKKNKWSKS